MNENTEQKPKPGICIPWEEKLKEIPEIQGDHEIVKQKWEENEFFAHLYVWHCLVSF